MANTKKKAALLANITVDLIAARLQNKYDFYIPQGFDTYIQEIIDAASGLYTERCDSVIMLLDGTEAQAWRNREEAVEKISLWKQALSVLLERITDIPIFVTTVDIRENRIKSLAERKYRLELENDWYQFIQGKAEKSNNLYVLDLADVIADVGRNQFYSDKMWYMGSMPYARNGLNAVAREIDRALDAAFAPRKKIISLDLDDTLWGGVVGEDGLEGIELSDHKEGQRFYDFQRQLLEMKKRGILLALNSKNDPDEAEAVLQNHPAMLLRSGDFVSKKINWENKAVNLKAMESELNLTESGFIFIDDNPMERETVKGECPEADVPMFPEDTTALRSFAEEIWLDSCRPLRVLGEDLQKTEMYRGEARRKQEMNASLSVDEYIAKLEIKADIHRIRPEEFTRAAQLCAKTNQFNVTTRRYTQADLERIAADPDNAIFVAYASDKYGDSGLVSVIILMRDGDAVKIDTFLMSCRVMGRRLEDVIINELAAHCSGARMIGEYIPTEKNVPVKELYDRLGFRLISEENGHRSYELLVADHKKGPVTCYKEIRFEDGTHED